MIQLAVEWPPAHPRSGKAPSPGFRSFAGLVFLALSGLVACEGPDGQELREALRQKVSQVEGEHRETLEALYAERDYLAIWLDADRPRREAEALLKRFQASDRDGLNANEYGRGLTERISWVYSHERSEHRRQELAALEIDFSAAFVHYSKHLMSGRVEPDAVHKQWHLPNRTSRPLHTVLSEALRHGPDQALDLIAGRHEGYLGLREALARYREIRARGGWSPIPGDAALDETSTGERVIALRRRLAATGDLDPDDLPVYDAVVAEAVRRFQKRHGLTIDGIVGRRTLAELNVPVEARIRQLELNLERLRWMPERFGDEYILVNIPDFRLAAYRGGEREMEMPVIVGKPQNPTPVLAEELESVVFSPFWNVPPKIATKEILPQVVADPTYLVRKNFEILGQRGEVVGLDRVADDSIGRGAMRIRQKPGRGNSLGRAKFVFPNRHQVYMHGTPEEHLFERTERDLSHGCVRVARPNDLAEWVLRGRWSRKQIEVAMSRDEEKHVRPPFAMSVFIVYLTAWVDDEGRVQFRDDVYGLDPVLSRALDQGLQSMDRAAGSSSDPGLQKLDSSWDSVPRHVLVSAPAAPGFCGRRGPLQWDRLGLSGRHVSP